MNWGAAHRETVTAMLEAAAAEVPDKTAVWFGDTPVTYGELWSRSISAANALADLGIERGDKVAILMDNSPEHVYALFGAASIGAVEVAINTAYRGDFLSGLLRRVEAKALLLDSNLAGNVSSVAAELPDLATVLVRPRGGVPLDALELPGALKVLPVSTLLDAPADAVRGGIRACWNEPSSIQYTSGTTGPSKAALMSQNFMVNMAREYSKWWYREPADVFYTGLPLFHGLAKILGVLAAVHSQATCVIEERFSLSGFWDRVRHFNATSTACPEAVLIMLWNLPREDAEVDNPLHTIVAAPIPADLHTDMQERWGINFVGQYSLSEASPLIVGGIDEPLVPGTSGKVRRELFDVRIFNEDDDELPAGETGEVVVRPLKPNVMFDAYCNDHEVTTKVWRNLWFHTGDLGKFDEDGNFIFMDRKKDYIRRRAENISSFEVERAVVRFPGILQAAAVGVRSEFGEEEVKICIIPAPGVTVSFDDLLAHCAEHMPYYAVPRYMEVVEALPLTPSGKVQKHALRELGVTDATWDHETAGYKVDRSGLSRVSG